MAGRAAAVILALMVLALTVLGVDYVLDYLGTDIVLNFYPWDSVSLQRLLKNTAVFAFAVAGWLITLVALIVALLGMGSERLWRE
jgi:hypothetical protein